MRRSSGSFFIFRESFLTVPGDLSLSITLPDTPTFFWEAGLESEGWESEGERDFFLKLLANRVTQVISIRLSENLEQCGVVCKRN